MHKLKGLLFNNLQQVELSIDKVNDNFHVIKLQNKFETGKLELLKKSRTNFQNLDYIVTIKIYIKAKRVGNWTMRLECTHKMFNFFAGTADVNCAKSARLYLQIMLNLHADHPWLFEQVYNGFHLIQCTD